MSVSLDTAVADQVEDGNLRILPLIKFVFPEATVGYHYGGRPLFYPSDSSGIEYKPNRWLSPDSFHNALGNEITRRVVTFSNVPTDDPDDLIAAIDSYTYLNAPVIVSYIAGVAGTNEILGLLSTQFYEIDSVAVRTGATSPEGDRSVTVEITLEPPQRRVSDQSYAKASLAEQQYDNDTDDTFFEYAATSKDWMEKWGQIER